MKRYLTIRVNLSLKSLLSSFPDWGEGAIKLLTAEVEVDGGGHLAELVLGLDLVEAGVGLDDVIQLQNDLRKTFRNFSIRLSRRVKIS